MPIAVQAADGGIAQLARAFGSYPKCPRFESRCRYQIRAQTFRLRLFPRPVGQVVKTPPFHGGNMGSSPVRVTIKETSFVCQGKRGFFLHFGLKMGKYSEIGHRSGPLAALEPDSLLSAAETDQNAGVLFAFLCSAKNEQKDREGKT